MSQTHPATNINPNDDDLGTGWDIAVAVIVVVIVVAIVGTTVWYRRRNRRLRAQVAESDPEKIGNVEYDFPTRPPAAAGKRSSRYYWEH